MGLAEINSFIACWVERFGGDRPIAGYAHPISFTAWPLTWFMKQIGGIPSTYAAAEATLAAGVPILRFPAVITMRCVRCGARSTSTSAAAWAFCASRAR